MSAFHVPPRRAQALAFIKAELAAGRPFPSGRALAAHMGWKQSTSGNDCLAALANYDRVLNCRIVSNRKVYTLKEEAKETP